MIEFGDYRLIERIGAGCLGEVWRAEAVGTCQPCAIKVLPEVAAASQYALAIGFAERTLVPRLAHPHIVKLRQVGLDERSGRYYLVTDLIQRTGELVEEAGVAAGVARQPAASQRGALEAGSGDLIPEKVVLRWALQVASALAHAHEQGVTHRGIKPGNVLIDRHGNAVITDFGRANSVGDDYVRRAVRAGGDQSSILLQEGYGIAANSSQGTSRSKLKATYRRHACRGITGWQCAANPARHAPVHPSGLPPDDLSGCTPSFAVLPSAEPSGSTNAAGQDSDDYMAPEQRGELEAPISPATDIYAFGVLLHNLLTGQHPKDTSKPISRIRPGLSKQWDRICARCLAYDPADRYADGAAVSNDLQKVGRALQARHSRRWMAAALGAALGAAGWWHAAEMAREASDDRTKELKGGATEAQIEEPTVVAADTVPVRFTVCPPGTRLSLFDAREHLILQEIGNAKGIVEASLEPGSYHIEAQHDGFERLTEPMQVTQSTATHTLELTPLCGRLTVVTTPGAEVTARSAAEELVRLGTADEQGEFHYERLVEGVYSLTITHPDYETATTTVTILHDRRQQARRLLRGKPGSIYINASPQADVYVDGVRKGSTGALLEGLQPGERQFAVIRAGFRPARFPLIIPPNREVRKDLADLVRENGSIRIEAEVPAWARAHFEGLDKHIRIGPLPAKTAKALPHTEPGLSCEVHEVFLEVDGFTADTASRHVRVEDGQSAVARFIFAPVPARLIVETDVPGAEVFDASGRRLGAAKAFLEVPPLRPQSLTIRAPGHLQTTEQLRPMDPGRAYMHRVALTEIRGLVAGENWKSLSTDMEFIWMAQMRMWVGKFEVTNGEYRRKEPGHDSGSFEGHSLNEDRQPVVNVNFDDAKAYAEWLTQQDRAVLAGARYRLPSNREWLTYAQCGDGRTYPWGDNWPPRGGQGGNYHGQEGAGIWPKIADYTDGFPVTASVDRLWRNPWGLYGVGGNVWEACASDETGLVFGAWRGASWAHDGRTVLRCSFGRSDSGSNRDIDKGFRLILEYCSQTEASVRLDGDSLRQDSGSTSRAANPTAGNVLGIQFVEVKAGRFQMGTRSGGASNETPVRTVHISKDYWMAKKEVTQWEYQQLMGSNPSHFKGDDFPVESVTWAHCAEFCRRLTEQERRAGRLPDGDVYRLPTEAEWEYAARGGRLARETTYAGSNHMNAVAWHNGNSQGRTQRVGTKAANELGLHDISGNVREWVHDWYQDNYGGLPVTDPTGPSNGSSRVIRGGGWNNTEWRCRMVSRYSNTPTYAYHNLGIRVLFGPSL